MLDLLLGGWTITTIQSLRTGLPVTFTMAGSPYKYLPGETEPNIVPGQVINVPNYAVGPNLWPQSNQNPYFNINAFSYPAAFTGGNAGVGIGTGRRRLVAAVFAAQELDLPGEVQDQHARGRPQPASQDARFPGPEHRGEYYQPADASARTAPVTGYSYSNWYTPNPNFQGILRIEF